MFKDKKILIGVCGGIAAYKVCDIINYLKREGAIINVIMTKNATEFITPLTLETLSNNKVIVDMFNLPDYRDVKHISLAESSDLILVIPASANIIGKVSNGIADDMLTTTIMASRAKTVFALAMNNNMYENKIVQANISKLKDYGYFFVEPEEGKLACGSIGKGKLAKKETIIEYIGGLL